MTAIKTCKDFENDINEACDECFAISNIQKIQYYPLEQFSESMIYELAFRFGYTEGFIAAGGVIPKEYFEKSNKVKND